MTTRDCDSFFCPSAPIFLNNSCREYRSFMSISKAITLAITFRKLSNQYYRCAVVNFLFASNAWRFASHRTRSVSWLSRVNFGRACSRGNGGPCEPVLSEVAGSKPSPVRQLPAVTATLGSRPASALFWPFCWCCPTEQAGRRVHPAPRSNLPNRPRSLERALKQSLEQSLKPSSELSPPTSAWRLIRSSCRAFRRRRRLRCWRPRRSSSANLSRAKHCTTPCRLFLLPDGSQIFRPK